MSTKQFRPISLCNTLYKIIAKILVNRMRPPLTKIINPIQSAFVPQRSIHVNTLLTYEIMNKLTLWQRKNPGLCSNQIWKKPMTMWSEISYLKVLSNWDSIQGGLPKSSNASLQFLIRSLLMMKFRVLCHLQEEYLKASLCHRIFF